MPKVKLADKKKARSDLTIALLVSILFHLLFLPTIPSLLFSSKDKSENAGKDEVIYVLEQLPDEAQIVDVEDGEIIDRPPDDTSFLSTENRRVDQQTQAQITGPQTPRRNPSRDWLKPDPNQRQESIDSPDVGERSRAYRLNTVLPEEFLARKQTSPQPSNYLPEIGMGEQTLLNTREFAYAHFYIRMKREMEYYWRPRRVLERNKQDSRPEYRTVLKIVLNRDGAVEHVSIVTSSMIESLDNEAVSAVKKAAPFENPPKELVGANGKITIDHWHFIVTQRRALF